jgi:hypothetical protein
MNPDRWQRIEDLFEQALEREADELHSFLAAAWSARVTSRARVSL